MNTFLLRKAFRLVVFGLVTAVFSFAANAGAAETYTLNSLTAWPKSASEAIEFLKFLDLAQKEADEKYPGELKLVSKGAGEVISNREQVEALRGGVIDMVFTAGSYYTSIIPEIDLMSLTSKMPWEEREAGVFDYLDTIHNKKANAHLLGRVGAGSLFHLFLSKPIEKLADLKGKSIRSSATPIPFLKSVGATPIGMPPPDIYTALERGLIDGYILPAETIRDFGLIKPSKYMVFPGFYQPCQFILVNLDKWNALPAHLQELLTKHAEMMAHYNIEKKQELLKSELVEFEKEGMKMIDLGPVEGPAFRKQADKALEEAITAKAPEESKKIMELIQ
jgi:TRAP-type C4-dicarboxylate transport system substrate-binding protein